MFPATSSGSRRLMGYRVEILERTTGLTRHHHIPAGQHQHQAKRRLYRKAAPGAQTMTSSRHPRPFCPRVARCVRQQFLRLRDTRIELDLDTVIAEVHEWKTVLTAVRTPIAFVAGLAVTVLTNVWISLVTAADEVNPGADRCCIHGWPETRWKSDNRRAPDVLHQCWPTATTPCRATVVVKPTEMRPRPRRRTCGPRPNRWTRSSNTPGEVDASAVSRRTAGGRPDAVAGNQCSGSVSVGGSGCAAAHDR
jgi:hypothetical protein